MNVQTADPSRQGRAAARRARGGLCDAAEGFSSRRAAAVPERHAVAVVRAAAQGRAGALLHQRADRALLVGDQIQRHHACRHQSRHLLLRRHASAASRSATCRRATTGRASSRWTSRGTAAQRKTVSPMFTPTHLDELAMLIRERAGQGARQPAAQRDLQFRRPGLDRADHADAGDAVRFPVGRAAQADALVRRLDRAAEERRRRIRRAAPPGDGRMRRLFHQALERARQCRAAQRPDLDDGA